jgi:hypothetical protein
MIKIKFNGSNKLLEAGFTRINDHVIELHGVTKAPSGFTTWRMDGVTQLGDFSSYVTLYRELENAVQLSDDGRVYVKPTPPTEKRKTYDERITALEATADDVVLMLADIIGG